MKAKSKETVSLSFPISELYIRDNDYKKFVEAGDFEIQVGNASDNILQRDTISVGQTSIVTPIAKVETIKREKGKTIKVKGTVRDIQATLIYDAIVFSTLLNKEVGKTNNKGIYNVEVPENDILVFKKSGYTSSHVEVNKQKDLSVSLSYDYFFFHKPRRG